MSSSSFRSALLLFCLGLLLPFAWLEPAKASDSAFETCPDDYYSFIANLGRFPRDLSVFDFGRGFCQLNDLMVLDDELESVRENFRSAAFDCTDTAVYKKEYYRLLMEMYFVRNVQKSTSDVMDEADQAKRADLMSQKLKLLQLEMSATFVNDKGWVTQDALDDYFLEWTNQYEDRLGEYSHCEEGPWSELSSTWKSLWETIQSINFKIDKPEDQSLKEIVVPDTEGSSIDQDMRNVGQGILKAWEFLQGKKETAETEIEPPKDVSTLGDDGPITFDEVFKTLNESTSTFEIETNSVDRMTKYEALYGMGGSVAATKMQTVLQSINASLEESNIKDLPNITTKAAGVYDKECK